MEKNTVHVKSKNRFLKFLPKAAAAVSFQSPPFSPNKDNMRSSSIKPKTHLGKGLSSTGGTAAGPTTSIIPAQALYKSTNSFKTREPTSPKISCMGQIKQKKKLCKYYQDSLAPPMEYLDQVLNYNNNNNKKKKVLKPVQSFSEVKKKMNPRVLKPVQSFKNMFVGSSRRNSGAHHHDHDQLGVRAPTLSQMPRFSSGRSSLSSFDWTAAQIAPVESSDHEDKMSFAVIQNLGACKAVSLEPRKEINLWKRRTMTQPKPLQLSSL